MSAPEIADLLHYEPVTVRRWIARRTRDGIGGLPDRHRSGRLRSGSPRLGHPIHTLLQTPKARTTARLWRAARRPETSLRTFSRRLREQASRPRRRLIAKGDPGHDTTCAGIRTRIALPAESVVPAENETHIDVLPRMRSCWMPTGPRHRILTPGSTKCRTVHGVVDVVIGAWHHHVSVKNASVVFCHFLEQLLSAHPDAPVVAVLCDNKPPTTAASPSGGWPNTPA